MMERLERPDALSVLERAEVAHVAVVSEGEPYVTPVTFVMSGSSLRFRTAAGRRLEAISAGGRVCVEAYLMDREGAWESVVAWGTGRVESDDRVIQDTVAALYEKYRPLMGDPLTISGLQPLASLAQVVTVDFDEVTGMSSGSGLRPRMRPGRL